MSWRHGTKGELKARFAAVRVRIADGPPQRIKDKGQQHLPGEEVWLIGEHADRERRSIISPTCPPRQSCGGWPPSSRRAGFASRRISN